MEGTAEPKQINDTYKVKNTILYVNGKISETCIIVNEIITQDDLKGFSAEDVAKMGSFMQDLMGSVHILCTVKEDEALSILIKPSNEISSMYTSKRTRNFYSKSQDEL